MNIKALITTLVIGSSSIALADPSWQAGVNVSADVDAGPVVRDHRYEPIPAPAQAPVPAAAADNCTNIRVGGDASSYIGGLGGYIGRWLALTQPTKIERGREFIGVTANRKFSQLMLQADGGRTHITEVAIFFRNGREQVVRTNTVLDSDNTPSLTIALQKRAAISRIVVYGRSGRLGRYSVLAA